jgi:hypothetical protein
MLQNSYRFLIFAVIYVPVLAVFVFTVIASNYADIPISVFLRDPTFTLEGHPLTGLQSNLGVLIWCAAGAVCLFSSAVLRRRKDSENASFFLWSGAIVLVLMLDDFFLFHDDLATRYLRLDEKIILPVYGLTVAFYIVKFRLIVLNSKYLLLLMAGLFFSLSVGIDFFLEKWESPCRIFLEDGFKFLGIASWSDYLFQMCFQMVGASVGLEENKSGITLPAID